LHEDWIQATQLTHGPGQRSTIGRSQWLLTCCIDLGQHQGIGCAQDPNEVIKQVTGSAVTMGLKDQDQASVGIGPSNGL
jgi:hypothetical protein